MLQTTKIFADQVSTQAFLTDFFYVISAISLFLVVPALALIDAGLVAPKHMTDVLAQKLGAAFISGACCMIGGYALWMYQFNVALGVPHPLQQAYSDWWLFGRYMGMYSQNIDPAAAPGADVSQIFVVFFFAYAAVFGAFIHSIGLGRMKPSVCYILSAIAGGILMPIMVYLTWSSASPLTNNGMHDFVGAYSLYMFIGVWGLIIAWRLGPRIASTNAFNPHLLASGAMLLMVTVPVFVLGCGFMEPGIGYFGVTNTTTGLGIVFCNVFFAYSGGAISGLILAYWKHKPVFMFLGCISGYACCSALFDIAAPWQCFVIALCGPWLMHGVKELLTKLNIDDQKIVPLALCPSILSVLMAGIIGSGLPTGGVPGGVAGYGFQHSHISFAMQCIGVLVTIAISGGSGLILVFALEKTLGLRIERTIEQDGIDTWYWNEWRKSRKMHVSPKALSTYERPNSAAT